MAEILVLGAGLNGLSTAMLLARDGHEVTVLERDPSPAPPADEAWANWQRRGVNQFRMLHLLLPRWRSEVEAELPEVIAELVRLGGARVNVLHDHWPSGQQGPNQDGDERFETVTARRPVLEAALANVAERTPGVCIRRGAAVTGLVTSPTRDGVPHVAAVRLEGGETLRADLVVDCCGRRSPVSSWLEAIGARPPLEEREDCGFIYYCRHFKLPDGGRPIGTRTMLQHHESVSVLHAPADNDTCGVVFVTSAEDRELRALRDPARWDAALALYPGAAPWGQGEAITGVDVMAGIEDRRRRFVVDGDHVATGIVAVGDSWACTNPSLGRGASIGFIHACSLRDLLRETDPAEADKLARRFDELTQTTVNPLYETTLSYDRHRLAEIEADIAGEPYTTDDPSWAITKAVFAAALADPAVLRSYSSIACLLTTPDEELATPGLLERVIELGATAPAYPLGGPSRRELLATIAR
jgi:2-polyprenyl-6-methoxyphenol hydroxylase-like FAD-dependent oxidoreductase